VAFCCRVTISDETDKQTDKPSANGKQECTLLMGRFTGIVH